MPYKHPDLGVECMTLGEFWSAEAKQAGKEPAEVMCDFYDDIASEQEAENDRVKKDKSGALIALQEYYHPNYFLPDLPPFEVEEVIDIVEASCKFGYREDVSSFTALVKCSDKTRYLRYIAAHYSGSYMEPPEHDVTCEEIDYP